MRTTNSEHGWPVYPNLSAQLEATGRNQLWVADLTYIRLRCEFAYLGVVLGAWSRRVVGWALGETLEAELTLTALRMAIDERRPQPGLVHHSDRGVQYACGAYRALLEALFHFSRRTREVGHRFCSLHVWHLDCRSLRGRLRCLRMTGPGVVFDEDGVGRCSGKGPAELCSAWPLRLHSGQSRETLVLTRAIVSDNSVLWVVTV